MLINESSSLGDRSDKEDDTTTMLNVEQREVGLSMLLQSRDPFSRRLVSFADISLNLGLKKKDIPMSLQPSELKSLRPDEIPSAEESPTRAAWISFFLGESESSI